MDNVYSKWGAIIVLIVVIATIVVSIGGSGRNMTSLFHSTFSDKRMVIVERYPNRVIVLGEIEGANLSTKLVDVLKQMDEMSYTEGVFNENIRVNVGFGLSDVQSRDHTHDLKDLKDLK